MAQKSNNKIESDQLSGNASYLCSSTSNTPITWIAIITLQEEAITYKHPQLQMQIGFFTRELDRQFFVLLRKNQAAGVSLGDRPLA